MFKKDLVVKSDQKLSSKECKKLVADVERAHPGLPLGPLLAKRDISLRKPSGGITAKLYCEGALVLLFEVGGQLYPSLSSLWRLSPPSLAVALTVPPPVSRFLISGADLMLPGVLSCFHGGSDPIDAGSVACVFVHGNPAPLALGRLLIGGEALEQALQTHPRPKGRCLETIHVFGDGLWRYGGKILPNPGFTSVEGEREVVPWSATTSAGDSQERVDATPGFSAGESLTSCLPPLSLATAGSSEADARAAPEPTEESEATQLAREKEEMDALLRQCFLQAAHKISKAQLPITANLFYANHIRPARPAGTSVDVKRSSHSKLLTFLQAMAADGLCDLQMPKTGEPTVCAIHRHTEAYRSFVCWEGSAADVEKEVERSGRPPPVTLSQLYRPREQQRPVFEACGEKDRKKYYSLEEALEVLGRYLLKDGTRTSLGNGELITLDPVLTDALFQGDQQYNGSPLPTQLQWHALKHRWQARLEMWTRLAGSGLEKPKLFSGKAPPPMVITTQQRRGHSITVVDNLSTYGIDLEQLAEQLQTNLGARAWLEGAGSVLVQGLWDRSVADHMSSVYGLPSSCIDNKAAGKTGMSQRKEKKATNIRTK